MYFKPTWQGRVFDFFNTIFLAALAVVTFYPLWYIFCASFSDASSYISHSGLLLWPIKPNVDAYKLAFEHPLLIPSFFTTVFVVVVGTFLSVLLSAIAAYFLSRKDVPFKRPIALLLVFTMYFSGGLIPFYFTVKSLELDNTVWVMIVPYLLTMYNVLVTRSGFDAVPDSIEEAAQIDGAGNIRTLFQILLPLIKPTLAVVTLYYAVTYWNSWFGASIFIQDRDKYPLQLVLRQILITNDTRDMTFGVDAGNKMAINETLKHSVSVIATVPILCLYPFIQKYFVKGVMVGAVKG